MNRYRKGNKDQILLYSSALDDRLPEDDEVYGFDTLIDNIDISAIEKTYSKEGGLCFPPRTMIKVIFYAYRKGIFSSRKIAWATRSIIQFIYLCGDLPIAHRTISDFRANHGPALKQIFQEIVRIGYRIGIITGKFGYQDGVKIKANASDSAFKSKSEWEKESEELKEDIENYFAKCIANDKEEDNLYGKDNDSSKISYERTKFNQKVLDLISLEKEESKSDSNEKQEIIEKAIRYEKIEKVLDSNQDAEKDTKLNLTDSDTRFMKSHGKIEGSYNGQAITENQFITAADVTTDATDFAQVDSLVQQHKETLMETKLENYGADAGYFSGKNLKYLEDSQIEAFIPESKEHLIDNSTESFVPSSFQYNEDNDEYICPNNEILDFMRTDFVEGKERHIYGAKVGVCMNCPQHESCLKSKHDKQVGYRTLQADEYTPYRQEAYRRIREESGIEFYRKRKIEPESVFGNIRNNMGFKKFMTRGIERVKGEFMIMSSVHNISKILKYLAANPQKATALL